MALDLRSVSVFTVETVQAPGASFFTFEVQGGIPLPLEH